jgi:RHS repeat-associated protein
VYDTLNRLQTLTPPAAFSGTGNFGFSYDALSRRTQMTRPNGLKSVYAYDNLSRLQSVLHQSGSTTLDGASYAVDNAGNRTSRTAQPSGTASNYAYDSIYQLTGVTQGSTTTESYSYDSVGNRLSSLGVSPYSNNTSNQLTSIPGTTYTYDNNGNTLTKVVGSNTTSYAWDFENRMSSVTLPGTGGTVSFKYDALGRRIYKSSSSGTSIYAYDGDNLIEETNASGAVVARYLQTLHVDEPLAMLRSGATSFYSADGLTSVTSLSGSTGSTVQTYVYDSFGKAVSSTGSLANPFQYASRELDGETMLYNMRARYFDPSTGRFLNEDPLAFRARPNMYAYVHNRPLTFADPYGLCPCKKYWTSSGDPNNPIWHRLGMLGRGLGNYAVGAGKIAAAGALEGVSSGLATPVAIYLGLSSAGNLTSGTLQIMGAFMPDACALDKAADAAATVTSVSGYITLIRTGGDFDRAAKNAAYEGMATNAFFGGLGKAIDPTDVYDTGISAADALKKKNSGKEKCGCE